MLRILFALLLLLHGLIHLMGFAKAFKYAEISQLQTNISRPAGLLWLLSAGLFAVAAAMFLFQKQSWWMPAVPAVLLSQLLIIQGWQDAKFGTIANVLVLAGIVLGYAAWNLNQQINRELQAFRQAPIPAEVVMTRDMLASLPAVVQRWLEHSNCIGKPLARTVQLRQTGTMRSGPEGKWMPLEAEQHIRVQQPGFYWSAKVAMAPYLSMSGRDRYQDGKGHMFFKFLSLIPVADSQGPAIDQGCLLRYLAEIMWYPSAALEDYIHWEGIDSLSAKATIRWGEVEASGVFSFTPEGDVDHFDALRYYDRKTGATLEKWHIENDPTGFRDFNDIRIPARSRVSWLLAEGEFTWLRLDITELDYDHWAAP
ncbi:MAG: hypothetical protein IT260_01460 [Saprospiraceae bacterium]|nr:hypothetical protein [Saprospiraceae bacterium]